MEYCNTWHHCRPSCVIFRNPCAFGSSFLTNIKQAWHFQILECPVVSFCAVSIYSALLWPYLHIHTALFLDV